MNIFTTTQEVGGSIIFILLSLEVIETQRDWLSSYWMAKLELNPMVSPPNPVLFKPFLLSPFLNFQAKCSPCKWIDPKWPWAYCFHVWQFLICKKGVTLWKCEDKIRHVNLRKNINHYIVQTIIFSFPFSMKLEKYHKGEPVLAKPSVQNTCQWQ